MAIFAIGDLHLSLGGDKPMDVFPGWEGYLPKLEAKWRTLIQDTDTVILAGDTSWAMRLQDTKADFDFLQSLPGQKWMLKGNHDYWWTTARKMERYLAERGFDTLHILHNNCVRLGQTATAVWLAIWLCAVPGDGLLTTLLPRAPRSWPGKLVVCSCPWLPDRKRRNGLRSSITRRFSVPPVPRTWWMCSAPTAYSAAIMVTCMEKRSAMLCRGSGKASGTS